MSRKKRLKDMSARQAARLQSETIEERQRRLQDMSARQAAHLQLETSDERQMRLKDLSTRYAVHLQSVQEQGHSTLDNRTKKRLVGMFKSSDSFNYTHLNGQFFYTILLQ